MRLGRVAGLLVMVLLAASAGAQKPVAVGRAELSRHVVKRAPVAYPAEARAHHVSGTVVLLVEVSAAGKVTEAQPLSGPAMLRPAARKSVERWVYQPLIKDGKAVAATGLVRVAFHPAAGSGKQPEVEKFLNKVRAQYATEPKLAAEGFRCRVEPVWREFPKLRHAPPDSPLLERLKRTGVRLVVSRGGVPLTEVDKPRKPKLGVRQLAEASQLVAATRRMVEGFYETWLPFGIVGPSAPPGARMKKAGAKTVVEFEQSGVRDWMSFDAASRMLHFTELMPGGEAVEETPHFAASPDGLLYTGTDFDIHRASSGGKATTHGAYRITYQQVDGFRMPKMVEIEVRGSLDVHFRFTGCKVGGE